MVQAWNLNGRLHWLLNINSGPQLVDSVGAVITATVLTWKKRRERKWGPQYPLK
jgi:hypothetical protein